MKDEQVTVKKQYKASSPLLRYMFTGEVVAKFTNTAVLLVTEWAISDEKKVEDLNYRVAVRYIDLEAI